MAPLLQTQGMTRAHLRDAIKALQERVAALESGVTAPIHADIAAMVANAVNAIELPQAKDGEDGHTPTAQELRALIAQQMPTADDWRQMIAAMMPTPESIAARIPTPVKGDTGQSAYQLWQAQGHTGSEADFLASLKGQPGTNGSTPTTIQLQALIQPMIPTAVPGKDGHTPTNEELLALITPLIPPAIPGKDGKTPTNAELLALITPLIPTPVAGKSAYQLWLDAGNSGTMGQFLASLKGAPGTTDHSQLTNLATGDPHTQYLNPTRGDARYGQLASANTWTSAQTFTGTTGNGGAVGIVTLFNGQTRVVKASSKGLLALLGSTTRLLYIEDA